MPRRKRSSNLPTLFDLEDSLEGALNPSALPISPLLRLWVLRMLVPMGGQQRFIGSHSFRSDELAMSLGLLAPRDQPGNGDSKEPDYQPRALLAKLRRMHADAERQAGSLQVPATLEANARQLAQQIGLNEVERRILEFAVLLHAERVLEEASDQLGPLSTQQVAGVLAGILQLPEADVREAMSARGGLARCGLVVIDMINYSHPLKGKLELISHYFANRMLAEEQDPLQLIRDTVYLSRPGTLTRDNYPHAAKELEILLPYLRESLTRRSTGVNVLVYGPSGTGKSELARLVAQETGCALFEVASEDEDGDPVRGENRLRSYKAALSLLASHRALLLFDEIEDVFNDGGFGRKSTAQVRKAWINRMLEENPIPTLWLSNAIDTMDPAFLRRFDMVMELGVPPRQERERIIRAHTGTLLPDSAIARIASAEDLSPAVIARAARVVDHLQEHLDVPKRSAALELLINHTLMAQGHEPVRKSAGALPTWYDPRFINVDADPTALADGLRRSGAGRFCFYGPPGTGKSAFGRWLADTLGRPLLLKQGSDLISSWVGGTEQNLAAAFREARQSGAVLLIDEVDGFLRDRRSARQSWEVTGVNELLTQMEDFEGIFIASTNLMDGLDPAALRRFDLKLRFGYLKPVQAWELFCAQCEALGLAVDSPRLATEVMRLDVLTPGDFAVVARQHRFRQFASPEDVLAVLKGECAIKEEGRHAPIGFL